MQKHYRIYNPTYKTECWCWASLHIEYGHVGIKAQKGKGLTKCTHPGHSHLPSKCHCHLN